MEVKLRTRHALVPLKPRRRLAVEKRTMKWRDLVLRGDRRRVRLPASAETGKGQGQPAPVVAAPRAHHPPVCAGSPAVRMHVRAHAAFAARLNGICLSLVAIPRVLRAIEFLEESYEGRVKSPPRSRVMRMHGMSGPLRAERMRQLPAQVSEWKQVIRLLEK